MPDTFYVTTPIYYVNARPHLGHAYTTLVADSLTRFKRQRGVDALFLTGTDEHGVNIERAAEARGVSIKQHVDEVVDEFKAAFARLGVEYDRWSRTTEAYHAQGVQKLWRRLVDRGHIYKGEYEGWFCAYCNEFKEVEENATEPQCPVHGKPLDKVSEESYFFRLSAFGQPLIDLYESRPDFIQPESRRNEVMSFVKGGLKDLSISRVSVKWGIPVPGDANHTIYVWFEALMNYITGLGWGNDAFHDFDRYWPALHLVGKDILRFHAVYWPAFLLAGDVEVPKTIYAHGMWMSGGRRMSKTTGNFIDLNVLHQHFTPDMIRYFVLREMSFGQDGDFTYEALIDRVNSDLADGLGNLASRTLTMVRNYFDGQPPRPASDDSVAKALEEARIRFDEEFGSLNFSRALEAAWAGIASVDKHITENQPWRLAKDPSARGRLEQVIGAAYEGLRHLVLLTAPVLPAATREIWAQMGLDGDPLRRDPNSARWGEAIGSPRVGTIAPTFPKLNKDRIMASISEGVPGQPAAEAEKVGTSSATPSEPPRRPQSSPAGVITIEDFAKVELRAATVLDAERVPKADKLLRLVVDLGEAQPRQILAGIAQYYAPESVVGRRIIVVANLAPRKMRGLESNGMLLAASIGEEGRPVLATFTEEVPNGARLK
jgi:methionyl-tRNA synthetase